MCARKHQPGECAHDYHQDGGDARHLERDEECLPAHPSPPRAGRTRTSQGVATVFAGEEGDELLRFILVRATPDYGQRLVDGFVEVFGHQFVASAGEDHKGERHKADVHVAGVGELKRLTYVLGRHELVLKLIPEARGLKGFPGSLAIWRMIRVGYRDALHVRGGEILQALHGDRASLSGPEDQPAARIELRGPRNKKPFLVQLIDRRSACSQKDVHGRARRDLIHKLAGGADVDLHLYPALVLEQRDHLVKDRGKVRGRRYHERVVVATRSAARACLGALVGA